MDMQLLVGTRVKSSTAADTASQRAPRDHHIAKIWKNEDGECVAWSTNHAGGEHLRAADEDALRRRIMSLA